MSELRSQRAARRRLLAALLLLAGARLRAQPSLSPLALVGRWSAADDHPALGPVTTRVTIAQTLRFSGEAARGGEVFWRFAGTVELEGRGLTWRYADSTLPLNDAARSDTDDVLTADAERLVLRSRLSGKERVFTRVR
ncbi:MAG: hypothetical protein U5L03_17035 [Burkholderiaceae bacterium]|nr:hypothetical protein [Burkholderiaceae bacterium]